MNASDEPIDDYVAAAVALGATAGAARVVAPDGPTAVYVGFRVVHDFAKPDDEGRFDPNDTEAKRYLLVDPDQAVALATQLLEAVATAWPGAGARIQLSAD